jgi:hypothetical protein
MELPEAMTRAYLCDPPLGLTARLEHFDVGQLFRVFVPTVGHGAA